MQSVFLFLLLVAVTSAQEEVSGSVTVTCSQHVMTIKVPASDVTWAGIENWSGIPGCEFVKHEEHHQVALRLDEELSCGTTRVRNTVTGKSLFYQRLVLLNSFEEEESVLVKCNEPSEANRTVHNIVKRELPPGFREPDYIEITSEVTGTAPVPILGVGVRQDGSLVEGAINVHPGTPLTMEVYLDDKSAGTYGILVSYLEVTNNAQKDETIVYNGCTIDPNLFENFVTESGDFLAAKFRAFKFPESNYVLFRGTVDVCLDRCQGITCSDGRIGYGRKRRSIQSSAADPNKIFEVTMTTYIKFAEHENKSAPVLVEEMLREKLLNSGLSSGSTSGQEEVPLMRRSSSDPPSIVFNRSTGSYHHNVLATVLTSLLVLLLR